jgi:hypothetical protein
MKRNLITDRCSDLSISYRLTSLLQVRDHMNLHTVELRISLIDYFTIVVLKRSLPEASQSMDHSAHNEMADEMARGRLSGTIVSDRSRRTKIVGNQRGCHCRRPSFAISLKSHEGEGDLELP